MAVVPAIATDTSSPEQDRNHKPLNIYNCGENDMEAQMNIGNITFNQLFEELTLINSEIDLTEQSIEATQTELDKTEEQIEMIEEERIEEMRSQIEVAKKTLADKQFVLQERQELLEARQSYLQKLKGNVDEDMIPALEHDSSSNVEFSVLEDVELDSSTAIALEEKPETTSDRKEINSKLLIELQEGLNDQTLCLTQECYLTDDGFGSVCLEIKRQPLSEQEEFISKFVNYFRQLLTDEQVISNH